MIEIVAVSALGIILAIGIVGLVINIGLSNIATVIRDMQKR